MPETKLHLEQRTALYLILKRELASRARLGSDQFVYWNAKDPRRCLAPDAFVKLGGSDEVFRSWKTWERGTPELAIEILSDKDEWDDKLDRYHELGVRELVSYDVDGQRIRVWDRIEDDLVERVIEGAATPCATLGAFWVVAPIDGTPGLRLARDVGGRELWLTEAEAEHEARVAAEKRVETLEKQLRQRERR